MAVAPLTLGSNNQFDVARQKAQQQEASNLQTQKDALARRAAALGGGPSGAFIKQESLATDASARRLADANAGIGAQQEQAQAHVNEINQGQAFQTSERQSSQDFSASQNALQRRIAEGELTGTYNGTPTLAAKTAGDQHNLAVAGLTGTYNGTPTLAGKAYNDSTSQNALENKVNVGTTLSTLVGNWKTQGLTDAQIQQRMGAIFGGMDLKTLGIDLGALMDTYNPAQPAPAAAPPVYVPPSQTNNGPTYSPYVTTNGYNS